jgi:hypothetical protein
MAGRKARLSATPTNRSCEFGQRSDEPRNGANQQSNFQNGHGFLLIIRRP